MWIYDTDDRLLLLPDEKLIHRDVETISNLKEISTCTNNTRKASAKGIVITIIGVDEYTDGYLYLVRHKDGYDAPYLISELRLINPEGEYLFEGGGA